MDNSEIIRRCAINIYGQEAVIDMLASGKEIPLHTAMGWKAIGPYKVKRGEHGYPTKLWKLKKAKKEGDTDKFFLTSAYLFRRDQVEIVK